MALKKFVIPIVKICIAVIALIMAYMLGKGTLISSVDEPIEEEIVMIEIPSDSEDVNYKEALKYIREIEMTKKDDIYQINDLRIYNGDFIIYKFEGSSILNLNAGDEIKVKIEIKTDNADRTVFGYLKDDIYTNVYNESLGEKVSFRFIIQEDGAYEFYSLGASASYSEIVNFTVEIN